MGSCRCPLLLGCWERKRKEGSALSPLCPLHPPETQTRVPIPSHTRIPKAYPFFSPFSAPSLSMSTPEKIISSGSVSAAPAGGQQQLSVEPPRPHPAPWGLGSTAQGALIVFLGKIHAIPQLPGHQESRGRVPAPCSPSLLPGCLSLTVSWARCSPRHLPEQSSSPRVAVPSILVPFL